MQSLKTFAVVILASGPVITSGCDRDSNPGTARNEPVQGSEPLRTAQVGSKAPDNTGINVRDQSGALPTPGDQGNSDLDLRITKELRDAITSDDSLSFTAKNVKIISQNGLVTLRGPVVSAAEKDNIAAKARKISGVKNVDNALEVEAPRTN